MLPRALPPPMASTSRRSHRKFRVEKIAPSKKPSPDGQPRVIQSESVPIAVITNMNRSMRQEARSKVSSSGIFITGVLHDFADESHESAHTPQNQEQNREPRGSEHFVEPAAKKVPDKRRERQHQGEG